jgi:hypothetical protein
MENDFAIMTPARQILGGLFPLRKGGGHGAVRMDFARETPEEEVARDRRTLGKIAIGGGLLAGAGLAIIRKGRLPESAVKTVKNVAVKQVRKGNPKVVTRAKRLVKRGIITPGEAVNLEAAGYTPMETPMGMMYFKERDKLEKARDVAIIGGTGAVGAGALIGANRISGVAKNANATIAKVGAIAQRTATRVKNDVTPGAIAAEGGKILKKKVKGMFPTFAKAGKFLTKARHFETPAQRMGVIDFAEALKTKDGSRYASRLKVASGVQNAYREGSNTPVDLPIGDGQVIKSAYRKAGQISKWGTRGGKLAKDAADVVTGKPRSRDTSGRKKKREWEKSWAQEAGKKAVITGAVLGYATGMKRSPRFRNANLRLVKKAKDTVNKHVPNTFETPAQSLLGDSFQFSAKKKEDKSLAIKAGIGGAAIGAGNGAVLGTLSSANSKEADEFFKVRKKRALAGVADGEKAFRQGMVTKQERWARADHNATSKLRKTMRKRSLGGGLAGAALLGGAGYIATRVAQDRKKSFSTPAQRMGVIEMDVLELRDFDAIAKEAGWDVRDPRGRSARVFAPGSRRRVRREKKWSEEIGNERALWKGGVVGAGLLAGAAGIAIGRKMRKPKLPVKVPVKKPVSNIMKFPKKA